jgi:predicted transcriptional regulator
VGLAAAHVLHHFGMDGLHQAVGVVRSTAQQRFHTLVTKGLILQVQGLG